eukprot:5212602-Amphidinium_carterae.1
MPMQKSTKTLQNVNMYPYLCVLLHAAKYPSAKLQDSTLESLRQPRGSLPTTVTRRTTSKIFRASACRSNESPKCRCLWLSAGAHPNRKHWRKSTKDKTATVSTVFQQSSRYASLETVAVADM